jgi:transmembrane sensor
MKTIAFPNMDNIEEQAAEWVSKIDRGLSAYEQQLLDLWLAESEFHGDALVRCASMWDLLDVLKPIAALMPIKGEVESVRSMSRRVCFQKSLPTLIAACFMLLIGALVYTNLPLITPAPDVRLVEKQIDKAEFSEQVYKTAVGEISTVSLADGSSLELNTDSEVLVKYTEAERNIELLQGEVYFDVAKDNTKPFVVQIGQDKVTAVGTAFSIDAGDSLGAERSVNEVIVTHGKIMVNRRNSQLPFYLENGQKAVARDDSFEVTNGVDSESKLAWREGMIVFQGESLTEVIRELNRYTPLRLNLADPELASISVGGFFKTGDLDQLLIVLENNFGVSSQVLDDEIRLTKLKPL